MESVGSVQEGGRATAPIICREGSPPQRIPEIRSQKQAPNPRQQHPWPQFNLQSTANDTSHHQPLRSTAGQEWRPTPPPTSHPFKRTSIPTPSCQNTMRAIYGVSWRIAASLRNGTTPKQQRTAKACCFQSALEMSFTIPKVAIKSFTVLGKARTRSFGWPGI